MLRERPLGFKVALVLASVFGAFLAVVLVLLFSREASAPAALAEEKIEAVSTAPAKIPTRVEYRQDLAFFNPVSGDPAIWYYKLADGSYDLFDAPGYHPTYGREAPLQSVTSTIAGDIEASFRKEVTPLRTVSRPRPAPRPSTATRAVVAPRAADPPATVVPPVTQSVEIPAGTRLEVVLDRQLSTGTNSVGDSFPVSLTRAIVVDGQTILAEGTRLTGEITALEKPGRVSGVARMTLVLENVGAAQIETAPLILEGEASKERDAVTVGIGAGIGAAVGAIFGGGSGAAKGTAIGGGAGAGQVLATKGQDLVLEPERELTFVLSRNAVVER